MSVSPLVMHMGAPSGDHIRSPEANLALATLLTLLGTPTTADQVRAASCSEREEMCVACGLEDNALAHEISARILELVGVRAAPSQKEEPWNA